MQNGAGQQGILGLQSILQPYRSPPPAWTPFTSSQLLETPESKKESTEPSWMQITPSSKISQDTMIKDILASLCYTPCKTTSTLSAQSTSWSRTKQRHSQRKITAPWSAGNQKIHIHLQRDIDFSQVIITGTLQFPLEKHLTSQSHKIWKSTIISTETWTFHKS